MSPSDQATYWDQQHQQGEVDQAQLNQPTPLGLEALSLLKTPATILELGCGVGRDSAAFAQAGHEVWGTDFSEVVIANNQTHFNHLPKLHFQVMDTSQPFPFSDQQFDLVYARLSLHYFPDQVTKRIFQEMHRVLKPGGWLCFMCKSVDDVSYGKGTELEPHMFDHQGHIRHFFSEAYATECLSDLFSIQKLESGTDIFYQRQSAFVKVLAKAI